MNYDSAMTKTNYQQAAQNYVREYTDFLLRIETAVGRSLMKEAELLGNGGRKRAKATSNNH